MDPLDEPEGSSAAQYLDELFAEHRNARDLGEGLLDALVRLLKRNRVANLPAIREQLLDWVANMDGKRWGTALEALTRDPDPRNAVDIAAMVRRGHADRGWREQLILSLLRLKYADGLDLYRGHLAQQLDRPSPNLLTLLQHLYSLDYETALDWSAILFARLHVRHTGLGMAYANHLVALSAISSAAVLDLVRKTHLIRKTAGDDLRNQFVTELQKTWVRERIGAKSADMLSRSLVSGNVASGR